MPLTLANATLASLWPRVLRTGHVVIADGRIREVVNALPEDAGEIVNCSGRIIMPGNVCAHTHLYSSLARGMPAPPKAPTNFPEILEQVWWRLDSALDERSTVASAQIGVLDAVRAGTTTLIDHHASPNFIDRSLDAIAQGFDLVGARGVLCYEVTDRGGPERRHDGLRENERFLQRRHPRLRGLVGAHASFTLNDDTLIELAELAGEADTGVHIHVAEDRCDQDDSQRRAGKAVLARLEDAGIVRDHSVLAHGVHLSDSELESARECKSWLVHNCRSNLNNGVGRARPVDFGERSALGTDGIDGDMFAESRTAYFRAREDSLDRYADEFTDMLARGAALAGAIFDTPIGTIQPGAVADLMVLNYDPPTPLTAENLAWHWMFGLRAGHVESVMIDGQWVLRQGEFTGCDEESIRAQARIEARRLWSAMGAL